MGVCVVAKRGSAVRLLTRLAGLTQPVIPQALHPREPNTANREPPSNTNSNTLTLTQSPLARRCDES